MSRIADPSSALRVRTSPVSVDTKKQVHHPQNGVGFAHGDGRVDPKALSKWLKAQPPAVRRALQNPSARIVITGRTSGTGGAEANQKLAETRAHNTAEALRHLGIKAKIELRAQPGKLTGTDDPKARVATIGLETIPQDRVINRPKRKSIDGLIKGFGQARKQSRGDRRKEANTPDLKGMDHDLSIAYLEGYLFHGAPSCLGAGPLGALKLFHDGIMAMGKAKAQGDAKAIRREIGRGFAAMLCAAAKGGDLDAASKRATSKRPSVLSESVYRRQGLRNTKRWHERDKKMAATFDAGAAAAKKLLGKLDSSQRKALMTYINKESSGSSDFERIKNFINTAIGANEKRVLLAADPMKRLEAALKAHQTKKADR